MAHEVISYAWAKFKLKIFKSLGNKCKKITNDLGLAEKRLISEFSKSIFSAKI